MTDTVSSRDNSQLSLAQIAAGSPYLIGSFRFWFADQRWEWSDQVAALHGYEPGTVTPTTELLLSHKHPDDRDTVAETLAASVRHGQAFCSRHRIIDATGTTSSSSATACTTTRALPWAPSVITSI